MRMTTPTDHLRLSMERRSLDELRAIVAASDRDFTPEARRVAAEELKKKEALPLEFVDSIPAPAEGSSTLAKIGAVIGFLVVMRMMMKVVFYFFK